MRAALSQTGYWHYVADDRMRSLCGRALWSLNVREEREFDHAPAGRICEPCEVARLTGEADSRQPELPVSYGTLRKTGPLAHGTRGIGFGRGTRLPPHST